MSNRFIHITLFLLLGVTIFYSCVYDDMANCYRVSDKNLSLKLVVSTPNTGGSHTRSGVLKATEVGDFDGAFNENKISKLDVLFYEGESCKWYPTQVVYNEINGTAEIPVPQNILPLFDGTTTYDIYVIVNGPERSVLENKTLTQLKNITLTGNFHTTNVIAPQPNFVMDGVIPNKAVDIATPDLGTVYLQRTAAKIRVRLLKGPNIQTYLDATTGATPLVGVYNGNNSASLIKNSNALPESFFTTPEEDKLVNKLAPGLFTGITTEYPIYSYPNDWSSDRSKETYLMIKIPLSVGGTTTKYCYKVPVNFQTPAGPQNEEEKMFYRLDRNHLYDVQVTINELGGTLENPVEVAGSYLIKNWTTNEVLGNITALQYLIVSEQDIRMVNTDSCYISYASSELPITISDITATFTYVEGTSGVERIERSYYGAGETLEEQAEFPLQRPNISVNADGTILIASKVPVNNVPKDITFKVSNGVPGLDVTVKVRQLPTRFITYKMGSKSSIKADGQLGLGLNNKSMYIFTTSVSDGTTILGYPRLDADGYTVNSLEVSRMLSPKFQLASQLQLEYQLAPSNRQNYQSARTTCRDYWEETIVEGFPVRYDDWRLPTEAEIALIDNLQNNANSAVKSILTGEYYWDAYSGNNAYQMIGGIGGTATRAHVRCVRDIK